MLRRLAPLLLLLTLPMLVLAGLSLAGGPDPWSADTLLARRDALRLAVGEAPAVSWLLFVVAYFVFSSAAMPFGPAMNLLAGYVFGLWIGAAAVLVAATSAAMLVFAVARSSLGKLLLERGRWRERPFVAEMRSNAFSYVVAMRLVPMVPFFLVNLAAGAIGVKPLTFGAATLIGRIPATLIYVNLGREIGRIGRIEDMLTPSMFATLLGLAVLALLPALIRYRRRVRAGPRPGRAG